jgi:hypothetical protein
MNAYLKIALVTILTGLSIANKPVEINWNGTHMSTDGPVKATTTFDANGNPTTVWTDENGNSFTGRTVNFKFNQPGPKRKANVFHGGTHRFYNGKHCEVTDLPSRLQQSIEDIRYGRMAHDDLEKACIKAFETLKEAGTTSGFGLEKTLAWIERIIYEIELRLEKARKGFHAGDRIPVQAVLYKIAKYGVELCNKRCNEMAEIVSRYQTSYEYQMAKEK